MPIYLFWGEDEFAMNQEINKLRDRVLDPNWLQFNAEKIVENGPDTTIQALNQALTPAFGAGGRFVWLADTAIAQTCSEALLAELKRALPALPPTSTLLLTTRKKPNGRSKSTKFLQKQATIREFSLIPPWKTGELLQKVEQGSKALEVKLTRGAKELLAESVGNNTRQLWNELEKLSLYGNATQKPLDEVAVARLVVANTQNSLQLAAAIRDGDKARALSLASDLLHRNEPALRIVATLIGQFRTWAIVRLQVDEGERDEKAIAAAAEVGNPKRIYFLRKEIQALSGRQLLDTFPILLELEVSLKRGAEPLATLQAKIVELCQLFR